MKKTLPAILFIWGIVFSAFTFQSGIADCYLSFKKATGLKWLSTDKLPAENNHTLPTANGEVSLHIVDGYRVLYNNKHKSTFVNLKVELSSPENYETDKRNVLANLEYLNVNSSGMESDKLLTLTYNGYTIYGISRAGISEGSTLGTFVMFPGDNTVVYFYFNNLPQGKRTFETLQEYQGLRNDFIGQYTSHLKSCKN